MKFTILPCLIILNISLIDAAAISKSLSSVISTGKQLNNVTRRDPGPYHGAYVKGSQEYAMTTNLLQSYSKGNPFPLYVTAKYCDALREWRVTYSVYNV